MLRPSNSLLGSSRAARRASARQEWFKAFFHAWRLLKALISTVLAAALDLLLLWALPFVYLASAYLALDLPARWIAHRPALGGWGLLAFLAALAVAFTGIGRAMQNSTPVAPVRPQFAKAMFGLSWVAGLLMTIGDLVSSR